MRIHGFLLVVLAVVPVCLATPGVGEFFEKLFGVFKPEGIVVTEAPDNATDSASNVTAAGLETKTIISGFDNNTEVINAKLTLMVEESLIESEETTTETTTDEDTTNSPSTITTVVYKLFHPNTTTTTAATTETTSITEENGNTTHHVSVSTVDNTVTSTTTSSALATAAAATTSIAAASGNSSQHLPESPAESTVTSAVPVSTSITENNTQHLNESTAATLAPSLASTAIVDNVLCKTTYNAATNLKVTSCADSSTPKTRKRSATFEDDPSSLINTIQDSDTWKEDYPSGSEVGDDDGDVFPSDDVGEYTSEIIYTY